MEAREMVVVVGVVNVPRWLVPNWSSNPSEVLPCGQAMIPGREQKSVN